MTQFIPEDPIQKANNEAQNKEFLQQQSYDRDKRASERAVAKVNETLTQQKALDLANKQSRDYAQGITSSDEGAKQFAELKASDKLKRQKKDYAAGIINPEDAADEAQIRAQKVDSQKTDIQRYTEKSDYDLGNQSKAWQLASKLKQSDAEQSNIAQKDRLVTQIGGQKDQQQSTINQANKLRSDDNLRAINGYKGNF